VSLVPLLWLELAEAEQPCPRAGQEGHPARGRAHLAAAKKNAQRVKATLVFVHESGFSLLPTACRTWSPRGQTPILRHGFNWSKLSAISAVTPKESGLERGCASLISKPQAQLGEPGCGSEAACSHTAQGAYKTLPLPPSVKPRLCRMEWSGHAGFARLISALFLASIEKTRIRRAGQSLQPE